MPTTIGKLIRDREDVLLEKWLSFQVKDDAVRTDLVGPRERRERSVVFIDGAHRAMAKGIAEYDGDEWDDLRAVTADIARAWSRLGVSPVDTAMFVLSFKQALFSLMVTELGSRAALAEELRLTTSIFDQLGLHVAAVSLEERDEIISRQREEVLELSTPVVEVWDRILVLPIIGVLDSSRTQQVMETLLEEIVKRESEVAILDITGVPAVDSVTAQHLVKTVSAARLMGTRCVISGVRPQIAQTMVTLGVDLGDIETQSSLRSALAFAIERMGYRVVKEG
ncbi:MAG: STAS domain-containing protein [Deltaproteobacteria bacterium]